MSKFRERFKASKRSQELIEMGFTEDDYVRLMTESEQRKEAERDLKKRTEQASGRVITICER